MRIMIAMLMLMTATHSWAQDSGKAEKRQERTRPSTNPFDEPAPAMGSGMGDMEGYGGDDEFGGEMGGGAGMDDMMGGGGMGGMGMGEAPDPETKFRQGLQRAIEMLKTSKDESNKEIIRGHIRTAFNDRYDRMIAQRKKDVERLRKSITKLETDLERRTAAKKRVVELQLQSVQLAAEGLLEINDPQPSMGGGMGDAPGGGGYR